MNLGLGPARKRRILPRWVQRTSKALEDRKRQHGCQGLKAVRRSIGGRSHHVRPTTPPPQRKAATPPPTPPHSCIASPTAQPQTPQTPPPPLSSNGKHREQRPQRRHAPLPPLNFSHGLSTWPKDWGQHRGHPRPFVHDRHIAAFPSTPANHPATSTGPNPFRKSSAKHRRKKRLPRTRPTLVAPMFPEPTLRISMPLARRQRSPNGMVPARKPTGMV